MSMSINSVDEFLNIISGSYRNTTFSTYQLFESRDYLIRMSFKVKENTWYYKIEIPRRSLYLEKERAVIKSCKKLLAQKETARICVKFWTGVDIE